MKYIIKCHCFIISLLIPVIVVASSNNIDQVQLLIDKGVAPEGVVFEIANKDKKFLDWALQEAEKSSKILLNKFPGLDIAVVTHGSEQFALTKQQLEHNTPLNDVLKSIVNSNIQVHVCGTHAERKGVEPEDFSELVDVAAEGPAQINDYVKLGYIRIRIK